MKKSLFAIAAVIATSAAYADAHADSVQIYGLIDEGYRSTTVETNGTKTTTDGISANTVSQSRIGFKGHEDLGAGNHAGFVAEFGINPNAADNHPLNVRQGYVFVGNENFGKISLGRHQTATHDYLGEGSAAGYPISNIAGSTYYNRLQQLDRANSIVYRLGGENFSVGALYSTMNTSTNATKGSGDSSTRAYEISSKARFGQLTLRGAYALSQSAATQYSVTSTYVIDGKEGEVSQTITPQQGGGLFGIKSYQTLNGANTASIFAGADYTFGFAKVGYSYYQVKTGNLVADGLKDGTFKPQFHQLSASASITPGVDVFGNYLIVCGNVDTKSGSDAIKGTGYQAGVRYNLSKRTSIYGVYGQQQITAASLNTKQASYGLGLRHTF